MKLKTSFLIFLILSMTFIVGCSESREEKFFQMREKANKICDNRNGEIVFVGQVFNKQTGYLQYESVCFKKDEQKFYYDLLE